MLPTIICNTLCKSLPMGIASAVIGRVSSVAANPRLHKLLIDALARHLTTLQGPAPVGGPWTRQGRPLPAIHVFGLEPSPVLGSSIKAASPRG